MRKVFKGSVIAIAVIAGLIVGVAPSQAATAQLTTAQKTQLKYLVEEEKLARDVYAFLAANVTSQKFANITKSEQSHMDQVSALLKVYGVWNPTINRKAGVFFNKDLQALYTKLTTEGSMGVLEAFNVGVQIEKIDIADLQADLKNKFPVDITFMMNNLLRGSQNHLAAFTF